MSMPQESPRKCSKCLKALGDDEKGLLCKTCAGEGSPALAGGSRKGSRSDMSLQVVEGSSSSMRFLEPGFLKSPESRPASGLSMQCNPAESSTSDLTELSSGGPSRGTSAGSSPLVLSRGTSDEKSEDEPVETAPQTSGDAAASFEE